MVDMDFFELKAAMRAKEPVMTKVIQPSHTTVIVGRVVGIVHRLDQDGQEIVQVEIKERGKNSISIADADKVDRVWEGALVGG